MSPRALPSLATRAMARVATAARGEDWHDCAVCGLAGVNITLLLLQVFPAAACVLQGVCLCILCGAALSVALERHVASPCDDRTRQPGRGPRARGRKKEKKKQERVRGEEAADARGPPWAQSRAACADAQCRDDILALNPAMRLAVQRPPNKWVSFQRALRQRRSSMIDQFVRTSSTASRDDAG